MEEAEKEKYTISIKENAVKELEKIPEPYFSKLEIAISNLSDNPRPFGYKKLKGSSIFYRIRISNYRIIYSIEDDILVIEVVKVGHRKAVYK